jgi:putative spermidine/putrescine transport system permease protein
MFDRRLTPLLLIAPASLFIVFAFLTPVFILLSQSFRSDAGVTLGNYARFFSDPLSLTVLWRTVRLGLLVTGVATVIGYAAALAMTDLSGGARRGMTGVLVLSLMTSPVARTYAWVIILGRTGLLSSALQSLGLSAEPVRFLFTETAVFLGLLQLLLPLMILPLMSALENLPADVVAAARILGAEWHIVFWRVILPLTREGLIVGGTLVFCGAVTAYITPAVLGGNRVLMLETMLYQRYLAANDLVTASVIACVLIVISVATNRLLGRLARGSAAPR